jgi:isoleucyl-tRNA synthetase
MYQNLVQPRTGRAQERAATEGRPDMSPDAPDSVHHQERAAAKQVSLEGRPDGSSDVPASVHHQDWPVPDASLIDRELLDDMALAIKVASLGRSARSASNVKLRQPLARAIVVADARQQARLEHLADIVLDELNVKAIDFVREADNLVHYEIGLLPQILGKKHGPLFPRLRQAVGQMSALALARALQASEPVTVDVEGTPIVLLPEETQVRMRAREGLAVADADGIVVGIDTALTPELEREGLARDLVRRVQDMRKNAGFEIEDRIALVYQVSETPRAQRPQLVGVFEEMGAYIAAETLAISVQPGPPLEGSYVETFALNGEPITLAVQRVP